MEITVESRKENPLLERLEVRFRVVHPNEKTPTIKTIKEELSSLLNAPKESIIVDHMDSEFGRPETVGYAKVYNSMDMMLRVEDKHILKRNRVQVVHEKDLGEE